MEKQTENDLLKTEHKKQEHHAQHKKIKRATKNLFTNVEVIFLIVVTAMVSILMTYVFVSAFYLKEETKQKNSEDTALQEFIDTYQNVLDSYYEDVDEQELSAFGEELSSQIEILTKEIHKMQRIQNYGYQDVTQLFQRIFS